MNGIKDLFQENTVISISGKAGTGKTSFSLFLIGTFLTSKIPYDGSCVWVQASEPFPKKRLSSMFGDDKKKLMYLTGNFFIIPGNGPFTSYDLQLEILRDLSEKDSLLPPDLGFIVIDNISHHLRFKLSQINDVNQRSYLINNFYDTVLSPLIFRCHREKINLILIHEVSFDVESQQTRLFFSKLYERIKGVHINLSKSFISNQRTIDITCNDIQFSSEFNIIGNGFNFSKFCM
jgi:hypothetical protein